MKGTQDDGRLDPENWRNDWFAEQLGARWQTSGDGIYTYVPDEGRSSIALSTPWGSGSKDRRRVPEVPGP